MIRITDTIGIEERELDERFVRASGPGGQNVNKVSTAVELRFDVRASSLPPDVKQRLIALAGSRMTGDGVLLIDSREHRTQAQNREAARARLVALLQHAAKRPKTRRPTKPKRAAKEKRLESKRQRSEVKSLRGRAAAATTEREATGSSSCSLTRSAARRSDRSASRAAPAATPRSTRPAPAPPARRRTPRDRAP